MVGSEIVLPEEGSIACFRHDHNKYMAPFAIYADLESTTKEITPLTVESTDGSYTQKYQNIYVTATVFMLFLPSPSIALNR